MFAVGSNERTTRLSGINVNRVKLGVYALMGAVVAIAALLQVSRIGAMDPANAGSGYELDAIAAVIVGGTSMSGGKGSVVGTVFGMLIIAVMNNLLNLLGVDPFLREAFKGRDHHRRGASAAQILRKLNFSFRGGAELRRGSVRYFRGNAGYFEIGDFLPQFLYNKRDKKFPLWRRNLCWYRQRKC